MRNTFLGMGPCRLPWRQETLFRSSIPVYLGRVSDEESPSAAADPWARVAAGDGPAVVLPSGPPPRAPVDWPTADPPRTCGPRPRPHPCRWFAAGRSSGRAPAFAGPTPSWQERDGDGEPLPAALPG